MKEFFALDNPNLETEIPSDVSPTIKKLGLSNTKGKGPLPTEIAGLTRLEHLLLLNCGFAGSLPSSLLALTSIEIMNVKGNPDLDTEIPPDSSPTVRRLSLGKTSFEGTIPPAIGNLQNLEVLDMGGSGLEGPLPTALGNLQKLQFLSIQVAKKLNETFPTDIIANLRSLTTLNMGFTSIHGEIPSELGLLTNLRDIILRKTDMKGRIPPELGKLSDLVKFSIERTDISGEVPTELGKLKKLKILDFERTSLLRPLPDGLCLNQAVAGFRLALDCKETGCSCAKVCCEDGGGCSARRNDGSSESTDQCQ